MPIKILYYIAELVTCPFHARQSVQPRICSHDPCPRDGTWNKSLHYAFLQLYISKGYSVLIFIDDFCSGLSFETAVSSLLSRHPTTYHFEIWHATCESCALLLRCYETSFEKIMILLEVDWPLLQAFAFEPCHAAVSKNVPFQVWMISRILSPGRDFR